MYKVHLSTEQKSAILAALDRHKERPEFDAYQVEAAVIALCAKADRPRMKQIKNVDKGFEPGEVKPLPNFNAKTDLPFGWGLAPLYDSGNNHRITNAGTFIWACIWNSWNHNRSIIRETLLT